MESCIITNESMNAIESCSFNSKNTRTKHAVGIIGAVVFLIVCCAIYVLVQAGISMYTTYTTTELQKQAVKYAADNGDYLDVIFDDRTAIGFNVNPGTGPTVIEDSNVACTRVIVKPRYSQEEYYRYSDGSKVYPYSIVQTE